MSRPILYTTFFILAIGVFFILFIAFYSIHYPDSKEKNIQQTEDLADLNVKDDELLSIKKSWLTKIGKEDKSRDYFFAFTQIKLELN